jgi:exopolysaccharide biosynthesis polyprenyl glycosylphosphotransferase
MGAFPLQEAVSALPPVVASDYRARDRTVRRLLAGADVTGLLVGLLVLATISHRPSFTEVMVAGAASIPVWLILFALYGLYRRDHTRIGHTTVDDLPWLFHSMLLGCPLLWLFFRFLPGDMHFGKILAFGAAAGLAILSLRAVVRGLLSQHLAPERLLLVGDDADVAALVRKLRQHRGYGAQPVGLMCRPEAHAPDADLPVLGHYLDMDLERVVSSHAIDRVVISRAEVDQETLLDLLRRCKQLAIKVSLLPELADAMGPSVEVDDVAGLTLIAINPPVLSQSSRAAKRAMDFVGAAVLLLATAPMLLATAIAVRLDSGGPILFTQERVGRRGQRFRLIKFRTMVADAEEQREALLASSMDVRWLHLADDPRITRVGRILRHTSLDELPQLWNVVRGEMSLVGPRPLIPSEDANLMGWARSRLDLTPGMSGLWQVHGRTSIPFEEMIKLDYLYVTNWSLWGDIRLVLKTLPAVFTRRGVN